MILVGSEYWGGWWSWLGERLLGEGKISPPDMELFCVTDDPLEVRERLSSAAHRQARASARSDLTSSTNAAIRSASSGSRTSITFSAFISPERRG